MDREKKDSDDDEGKMPKDPSAVILNDGAFERFLTSAIATILTLIFSWHIIIDLEHRAANMDKKRRIGEGKGQDHTPSFDNSRSEERRSGGLMPNGFGAEKHVDENDLKEDITSFKSSATVCKPQKDTWDTFPDSHDFGDRSLSDGEVEFLKAVEKNDDFTFDEEISLIPAQVPLIQVTPPTGGGTKRPLEPYQTYFGSDSDSDAECDHFFDSNKLSPLDDFYIEYEDSSPSGSDSEIFCRHVLEAISEEDEDDCESSCTSGSESDDENLEESREETRSHFQGKENIRIESNGPIRPSKSQYSHHIESNQSPYYEMSVNKEQADRPCEDISNLTSMTQREYINNSKLNHDHCHMKVPRVEKDEDSIEGSSIRIKECIPLENHGETRSFVADFSENVQQNGPAEDSPSIGEKSLGNSLRLGCHSDISFIDADSSDGKMASPSGCGYDGVRSRVERPDRFDKDLRSDISNWSESVQVAGPLTNSHIGQTDAEVSESSPGGSTDNANLHVLINSNRSTAGSTISTHTLHSPVHVERLLACAERGGLNTIQPSPSSKEHTGIISRNYYLDVKKPSMNRIRGQGVDESEGLNSSPFVKGGRGDVYTDSALSDGTQDTPRGFTFVRCTDYEEDYKVTSTLLFQPRDPGVRLNVCGTGSKKQKEEVHKPPRVIEVDVHDIGAILSDTEKAKAELLGDAISSSDNVWDDLGKFDEITSEEHEIVSNAPASIETFDEHHVASDEITKRPDDVFEPVIPEFRPALQPCPGDDTTESDNDSSSTTTGDTAIEVIDPKLSVVRIGSVDSNGTDEDLVGEILDDNMDDEHLRRVKKPEVDVNEEEPVFVNLAEKVHSPRFKTRRTFQTRTDPDRPKVDHNTARIISTTHPSDNSDTQKKNTYNKGRYPPGSGMQILGVVDRDRDHNGDSDEETGSNSDSSGSFDCGGENSPRGSDKSVPRLNLETLGEIEEEISSASSGEELVEKKSGHHSDISSTSSDSESSSETDSEYEDATEGTPGELGDSSVGNSLNIPATQRSGSEDTVNRALDAPCGSDTIGAQDITRPQYMNNRSRTVDTQSSDGVHRGIGYDNTDYTPDQRTFEPTVSTTQFESNASSSPRTVQNRPAEATRETPDGKSALGPLHSENTTAPDRTVDPEADDMYSFEGRRSSGGRYSADSDLLSYDRRPSYGKSNYISPLASYAPPASVKPQPKLPEYTETGVQTLRSYRQPTACTFSPERYFRPSEVDSVTFSVMIEHHGSDAVEEHEYSEKGVQVTFDPLWDRGEALVPSQDELSDECNSSSDSIEPGAFRRKPLEPASQPSVAVEQPTFDADVKFADESKSSSSSSSSSEESDAEFQTFQKEIEMSKSQADESAPTTVGANFRAPISLEEDFDFDISPKKKNQKEVKVSPRNEVKVSPRNEVKDSPRSEEKLPSPRGQTAQRPRTPPLVKSTKPKVPSVSVDIDIDMVDAEEPVVAAKVAGVEMAPPVVGEDSFDLGPCSNSDADDEESETEDRRKKSMYNMFSKPKNETERPKIEAEKPRKTEVSQTKPDVYTKKPDISPEKPKATPKKPDFAPPKPPTFERPIFTPKKLEAKVEKPESGKNETRKDQVEKRPKEKKEYKSVLQEPVAVEPKNISHLINLPDKIAKVDRSEIKEARQEYMSKSVEPQLSNEEERKALLSKLLGTRDWSDRPKPILKRPSRSFREIDDTRREALSRELSKSKEDKVGVYNKDDVKDRISAAVERQKLEDKAKFQRTPLRATVGPIACSRYNEEMLKKKEMSKSQTLPAGFSFGSPEKEKDTSRSTDDILSGKSSSLPRAFSVVLVRSPSMTLHRTASSFFSDRKSYTNLLETDIDTGESSLKPLVMETDLDEVLRIRQATMPPKSRSLQDLYSQAGLKSVVKDVYDDSKELKKWEKTQSLTALTSLSLSVYNDDENDEVFKDDVDKTEDESPLRRKTTSDHEIRITKSLTKLDLPDWYKKSPPKPAEPKSPKPSRVPKFHLGDSEIVNRSRTSSANSSFSMGRSVVISTRVTMPRTSPTADKPEKADFELPSQKIKKKQEVTSAYKPIRSTMEPLDVILSKSREALVEKELKIAERKRVTAQFQLQKWEAPVIKSPEMKRASPEVKAKVEPDTGELDPEKQKAIDTLVDLLEAENYPAVMSSPADEARFTSSVSMSLSSAKPPPPPKDHNTSSESELSLMNARQRPNVYNKPESHFKPVNTSSNSEHDSSFSSIHMPDFAHALARSSPDLTEDSSVKGRRHRAKAGPASPQAKLNLSAPPDEIESISDIENAAPTEQEITPRVQANQSSAPTRLFEKPHISPVQPRVEVQTKQEPQMTLKSKPPPPLRTSSRKEAERPTTLPKKTTSSAMDRLKPQRPAPGRPEPVGSEAKVTPDQTSPQNVPQSSNVPVYTKPYSAIHFQPNTFPRQNVESNVSIARETSPNYQAAPTVSATSSLPREESTSRKKAQKGSTKPLFGKKREESKSPESQKKPVPEIAKKPSFGNKKPADNRMEATRKPLSMSHPVNTSIESQETPSFRLARAPGSKTNSFRESPADYKVPTSPTSPRGYQDLPGSPRSPQSPQGSFRNQPGQPSSSNAPTGQRNQRPEVELRRQAQSPQTPQRPYTEIGHHPNWRPPPPEVLRRSLQGPLVSAPRAVIETDSDLSLYNSPEMSPMKKPRETDLDSIGIRRLPARAILETDIDGDLYDSPLRKKSHGKQAVLETNIDDDLSSNNSSEPSRNSSYDKEPSRNSSFRDKEPIPSLPPKRYLGYQAEPIRDPSRIPAVPPRWDASSYPKKVTDYGPAPDIPPRQTPSKPRAIETDIDGDLNSSDGSRSNSMQRSAEPRQQAYTNATGRNSAPSQNNSRYYDNVPGSKSSNYGQPQVNAGYQQQNQGRAPNQDSSRPMQQKSNPPAPSKNRRQQQLPLYYQNHQQNNLLKAPPIPPREPAKNVPPPTIHKADGLFETDIDFNLDSFKTVAVEGDENSNTPHGTLTRFGRSQKPQTSTQHAPRGQAKAGYDFDFEPPSNSIPPTLMTTTETKYTTCAVEAPRHVFSTNQSRPSNNIPMDTEEDILFSFIVNKQPKDREVYDGPTPSTNMQVKAGNVEYGPDSFQALGKRSDLKVDTNSFRFSKEEERFRCEVGFSGATEQDASLAEVLDGLLALPPSPPGSLPRDSSVDSLDGTPDSSPDAENGFFGAISESGENLLSASKRTQNIDENRVKVKCRNTNCGKEMVLVQARYSYKTCHNCYTYYCCRQCRRNDWTKHKPTCTYNRVASMCKQAIRKINKEQQILFRMSKKARAGYLESGRGCVLFVFQNLLEVEMFVKEGESAQRFDPVYCSLRELEEYYVLGEYGEAVMDMCVDYSPYMNFIVCATVVTGNARSNSGKTKTREGPVIKKCAKLSLSTSLSETGPGATTADQGALILTVGYTSSNSYLSPYEARDESFDNIQRKLRQRGVCLREQYPDVFNQLVAYVNENQTFSPITIYPYDGSTGNTFMCVIKAEQDLVRTDPSYPRTLDTFS